MMFETDYRILSMMIAPGLFMTATGSLILSSNNRLSRVIDRIRVLINLLDQITLPSNTLDSVELRKHFYHSELDNLQRRSRRIRTATAMLYLSFALFVGSSLMIGIDMFLNTRVSSVPTTLALLGVGSLLWACINLFRESSTAVRTVELEVEFMRCLHAERQHAPGK